MPLSLHFRLKKRYLKIDFFQIKYLAGAPPPHLENKEKGGGTPPPGVEIFWKFFWVLGKILRKMTPFG